MVPLNLPKLNKSCDCLPSRNMCVLWWSMRVAVTWWCTYIVTCSPSRGLSSTQAVLYWDCSISTRTRLSTGTSHSFFKCFYPLFSNSNDAILKIGQFWTIAIIYYDFGLFSSEDFCPNFYMFAFAHKLQICCFYSWNEISHSILSYEYLTNWRV